MALFSSTGLLEIAINKGVRGSGGGASKLWIFYKRYNNGGI